MRNFIIVSLAILMGCGGAAINTGVEEKAQPDNNPDKAIGIVRHSFDAMGGIERLRLAGGKGLIKASVVAGADDFNVSITLGGPGKWRIDYDTQGISYIHTEQGCSKIVFGVPAQCTPDESIWLIPARILQGLTFPAKDAASLGAGYTMLEEQTINGKPHHMIQIKPRGTKTLRMKAAFAKDSGLLSQVSFFLKNADGSFLKKADGSKTNWKIEYADWRDVDGVKAPFSRIISREQTVIWEESAGLIDWEAYRKSAFEAVLAPPMDVPTVGIIPSRKVIISEVNGQQVEVIAPNTTIGGGPILFQSTKDIPEAEVIKSVVNISVSDIKLKLDALVKEAQADGRKPSDKPGVILLQAPSGALNAAMMILYVPLQPK